MYHQYVYGSFVPLGQSAAPSGGCSGSGESSPPRTRQTDPLAGLKDRLSGLLGGLGSQNLRSELDTGDILLILIVLFLFLEGDNLELVITLGLMFLFGLNDPHSEP